MSDASPPPPPRIPLPWRVELPLVPAPAEGGWGLLEGGHLRAATPEELAARCRSGTLPALVWTPETPTLVPPEEVPALFREIRERVVRGARSAVGLPVMIFVLVLASALGAPGGLGLDSPAVLYVAFVGAWAGFALWRLHRARALTPRALREDMEEARHSGWLRKQPARGTLTVAVMLGVVGAAQLYGSFSYGYENAIYAAAVDGRRIFLHGEWWRLGTGTLLHGNPLHFGVNVFALWVLGRMLEAHAHRTLLPLVFVVAALTGSVCSAWFSPIPSVGASGGIMGIIGFLTVLAWRRRAVLPPGMLKMLFVDIALIGAIGLVGARFIDNAGHLGGLLGGALLGLALVPRRPPEGVGWTPPAPVRWLGVAATAVLVLGALATAWIVATGASLL